MDQVETESGTVNESPPVSRLRLLRRAAKQLALPIQPIVKRVSILMAIGLVISIAMIYWNQHLEEISLSWPAFDEVRAFEWVAVACYAILLAGIAVAISQPATVEPVISVPMHLRLLAIARRVGQLDTFSDDSVRAVVKEQLDGERSHAVRLAGTVLFVLLCLGLLALNIALLRELSIRNVPVLPGSSPPVYSFSFLSTEWLGFATVVTPMFSMLLLALLVLVGNSRVFLSRSLWFHVREVKRSGKLAMLLPDIKRELKGADYRIGNLPELAETGSWQSGVKRPAAAAMQSLANQQARLERISRAGRHAVAIILQRRSMLRLALALVTAVMLFETARLLLGGGLTAPWLLLGTIVFNVIAIYAVLGYNIPPDRRLAYSFDLLVMRLLLQGKSYDDLQMPANFAERVLLPELRKRDLDATLLGLALMPEYYSCNVRTGQSQHNRSAGVYGFICFLAAMSTLAISPLLGILLIASLVLLSFIRQLSASAVLGDYIEQVVPMYRSQLQLDAVFASSILPAAADPVEAAQAQAQDELQADGETPLGNLVGSMKLRLHDEDMQRIREAFKADVNPLRSSGGLLFLFFYWLMSSSNKTSLIVSGVSIDFVVMMIAFMCVGALLAAIGAWFNASTMPGFIRYSRHAIDSRMLILRLVSGEIKRDEVISSSIPIFGYFHRFPQVQEGPARALRDAAISLVVDHSWYFRPRQNYVRPEFVTRYLALLLMLSAMWLTQNLMFSVPLVLLAMLCAAANVIQQQRTVELVEILAKELESLTETG